MAKTNSTAAKTNATAKGTNGAKATKATKAASAVVGEFKTMATEQLTAQPMVVINTAPQIPATAVEMLPAPQEEHEVMRLGDELIAVAMDDLGSSLEAELSSAKGQTVRSENRVRDLKKQIETKAAAADTSALLASCIAAAQALNAVGGSVTATVTLGEANLEKRLIPATAKLVQTARNDDGGRNRYSSSSDSMVLELTPIRFDVELVRLADELVVATDAARAAREHAGKIDDEIRNMGRYEKKMRADLGRLRLEQTVGGQSLLAQFSARTQQAVAQRLSNAGLTLKQLDGKS